MFIVVIGVFNNSILYVVVWMIDCDMDFIVWCFCSKVVIWVDVSLEFVEIKSYDLGVRGNGSWYRVWWIVVVGCVDGEI